MYLRFTSEDMCEVYVPGALNSFLYRVNGLWVFSNHTPSVKKISERELADLYKEVDKFAEEALAYKLNKEMLL